MSIRMYGLALAMLALTTVAGAAETKSEAKPRVIDVAKVWSGHSVGFSLLTHGDKQFVAYYDVDRNMVVAQRDLNSDSWQFTKLDNKTGWDSHNYVTMAVDSAGYLHVTGNMHVVPLIYYRSAKPLDASTLKPVHRMVGAREDKVTYPIFLRGANKELIFQYRDGSSGNGDNLFNKYDPATQTWTRLIDRPLMDGKGKMNAYMTTPKLGPDGYFHVVWVWRDTPMAETCHDLSYIRSKDLVHWENARGEALTLPISHADNTKVVIDPIPVNGGIVNGSPSVVFLSDSAPTVVYHKFDTQGNTQLYVAKLNGGEWKITQMTHWEHRWDFRGGGSLPDADVRHSNLMERGGKLTINVNHKKYGEGMWEVDRHTLQLMGKIKDPEPAFVMPPELRAPQSTFAGMMVRNFGDNGKASNGKAYRLRWESLGANRDRPRPEPWPEPSMLQVIEYPAKP